MNSLQNGIQRTLKHMKTFTSLIKREMQIKTLMRCYFLLIRLANITKYDKTIGQVLRKQVFMVDASVDWSKLRVGTLKVLIKIANAYTL